MTDWLFATALWAAPAIAFNAIMIHWRRRMGDRGPGFGPEVFMLRYLWTVVDAGLACLIVGFATSPVHPSNSFFTFLGGAGMPVLVLGYLLVTLVIALIEDGNGGSSG